jgi:hypothetical protein
MPTAVAHRAQLSNSMQTVSAHDLTTGAAFVLPAHVRCVAATASHHASEVDSALHWNAIDPSKVRPLGSCPAGSIVYAEWKGLRSSQWLKLRVLRSPCADE